MSSPSCADGPFPGDLQRFFSKNTQLKFRGEFCLFSGANLSPTKGRNDAKHHVAFRQNKKPIVAKPQTTKPVVGKLLTREQVISAIQAAARKLDHGPSSRELKQMSGITASKWQGALALFALLYFAAGLKPHQAGSEVEATVLLEDWGKVARKLGRVPSNSEYELDGRLLTRLLYQELSKLGRSPSSFFSICGFRRTRGRLDRRIEDDTGRAHAPPAVNAIGWRRGARQRDWLPKPKQEKRRT